MENPKRFLIVGIGAGALVLFGTVALLRRGGPSEGPVPTVKGKPATVAYAPAPPPQHAPAPAPPGEIARATDTVRIRGTYQNYRRAVVTGDDTTKKTLLPILLRDREAARKCAEDDCAQARTDADRDVARRVLADLR